MAFTTTRTGRLSMHGAVAVRPKVALQVVRCRAPPVRAGQGLPLWSVMYKYLLSKDGAEFKSVGATEAKSMADSGEYVMVDVRPTEDFEKSTIDGAKSVPLFQRLDFSSPSPGKILRGLAYALNGVQGVEVNLNFEDQIKSVAEGKKVLLCCDTGGTMTPTTNFVEGKTSRSLKAAFLILREGVSPGVGHIDGGIVAWVNAKLPTVGEYDESIAGRSPNSAEPAEFPTDVKK